MSNNSPYNAYLRRRQIYRAMGLNPTQTDIGLILQPRDLQDLRNPPEEILDKEIATLNYLKDNSGFTRDINEWAERYEGATIPDAIANGIIAPLAAGANIGDKNGAQRSLWWPVMSGIQVLLNDMHNSIARTAVNPPADYDIIAMTYEGTDEETGAVVAVTAQVSRPPLYTEVQDILNRFRSVVFAPNSQSSTIRSRYFDAAYASTPTKSRVIRVNNIYSENETTFKNLERKAISRPEPDLFTFNNTVGNYGKQSKFVATRLITRLCALHNGLFGTNIVPFSPNIKTVFVGLTMAQKMLANCQAGLQILLDDIQNWQDVVSPQMAEDLEDVRDEVQASNLEETGFILGSMGQGEIDIIANNAAYNQLFSTTFNRGVLTSVPIIHNLYLTTKYFPEADAVFVGPKQKVLELLKSTIARDNEFPTEPNLTRPASQAAIANANGLPPDQFGLDAGKFILKMLIETPISILKGLVELIDPHVAVTKLIKVGSATGFREASKKLDPFATTINDRLQQELEVDSNLTGKNLMTLLLCLVDYGFEQGDSAIDAALPIPAPGNFFPDVSMKGVDFTGTVSGMLMVPPTPLGLLYLLLELVKSEIDNITINVDDAAAANAEENEC